MEQKSTVPYWVLLVNNKVFLLAFTRQCWAVLVLNSLNWPRWRLAGLDFTGLCWSRLQAWENRSWNRRNSVFFFFCPPSLLLPSSLPHLLAYTFTADIQCCSADKGSSPQWFCSSTGSLEDEDRERNLFSLYSLHFSIRTGEKITSIYIFFPVYHSVDPVLWFFCTLQDFEDIIGISHTVCVFIYSSLLYLGCICCSFNWLGLVVVVTPGQAWPSRRAWGWPTRTP